ncbi:MAG: hypothetical protein AB7O97_18840 [Planctomycetota bacterium]
MRTLLLLSPLLLVAAASAQGLVDEGPEPNDFLGTPTFVGCGDRVDGVLAPGDLDYYAIAIGAPTLVRAYTSLGRLHTATFDTYLEIRDANDVLLADDDDGAHGTWSYAGCHVTVPGIYHIVVRGFGPTDAGAYSLDILCDTAVVAEGPEPNGSPLSGGTPTPVACGSQHHGFLGAGDEDWWVVTHPGGNLVVTTGPGGPDVPAGSAIVDTVVEVLSATVVTLAIDDDGGEARYSRVNLIVPPPGTYYVKVAAFDPNDSGNYSLRVGCNELPAVHGTIAPRVTAPPGCNGCAGVPTLRPRSTNASGTGVRVFPRLGATFAMDVSNLPPGSLAINVLGFTVPPPLDLGPLGAPGCFASVSIDMTSIDFADAAGTARVQLFIPSVPLFSGAALHWQTASLAACHNQFGIATTNVVSGTIGSLAFTF